MNILCAWKSSRFFSEKNKKHQISIPDGAHFGYIDDTDTDDKSKTNIKVVITLWLYENVDEINVLFCD